MNRWRAGRAPAAGPARQCLALGSSSRPAGPLRVRTMQALARLFDHLGGQQVRPLEQLATAPLEESLARHRCYIARDRYVTPPGGADRDPATLFRRLDPALGRPAIQTK